MTDFSAASASMKSASMKLGPLSTVLVAAVKLYRALPRSRPPSCRFDPTCSQYALDAVRSRGAFRGGWLALRRICRCHPWGGWGYDPVPQTSGRACRTLGRGPDRGPSRGHCAPAAAGLLEH